MILVYGDRVNRSFLGPPPAASRDPMHHEAHTMGLREMLKTGMSILRIDEGYRNLLDS